MNTRWRTIALVSTALAVGTVVGPGVVQAATAGLVRLEGGGSTHVAKVSSGGKLLVDNGSRYASTGQLQVGVAPPAASVTHLVFPGCGTGDGYVVPHGKALIITGVNVYVQSNSTTEYPELDLYYGKPALRCDEFIAGGSGDVGQVTTVPENFSPGINVPAGYVVGVKAYNSGGSIQIYGYLVPAAAVPQPHVNLAPRHTGRPTQNTGH